jgi:hypothetical protein
MFGGVGAALLILGSMPEAAHADQSGVSYWLPGPLRQLCRDTGGTGLVHGRGVLSHLR